MSKAHVYFVQAGASGPIKIGYSQNTQGRLASLQTGNHEPLTVLASFEHADAKRIESMLHDKFSEHRIDGEWFRPSHEIIALIDAWKQVQSEVDGNGDSVYRAPLAIVCHEVIRSTSVRAELGAKDWWCVEWFKATATCQCEPLLAAVGRLHDQLIYAGPEHCGSIVAICESQDEAESIAAKVEPHLRAMSLAQKILDLSNDLECW